MLYAVAGTSCPNEKKTPRGQDEGVPGGRRTESALTTLAPKVYAKEKGQIRKIFSEGIKAAWDW